jgi:drug/metabolite transporter (DMT)-like permease
MFIPLLGAVSIVGSTILAGSTILQKTLLKKKEMDIKFYYILEFFFIVLSMLPFIFFFWRLDSQAFAPKNLFVFSLVILFSFIANVLTYYSMKWEKVTNIEPAKILEPIFVVLIAIVFSYIIDNGLFERNLNVIIPALIAGVALIFSHIKKHHLKFNKYFIAAVVGSFFFALELALSKIILDYYSPITFYFVRCSFLLVVSFLAFRPKFVKMETKVKWQAFAVGAGWALYRVIVYYGYQKLGVISTTLVLMLGPVLVYVFARKFLKEKLSWRNIVASIIILACVLYVTIF